MKFYGTCPVTKKNEWIDFDAKFCGDNENPKLHRKGLMNSCSVRGKNKCPYDGKCPIYQKVPENFNLNR